MPVPQAGTGQIRVRVTAAGLNPMDWFMTSDAVTAARFGLSLPSGFATDYAGVVDQVGDGATGFAAGDRVFGTGSATSADALRALGAEPVTYGDGLVDRLRALASAGVTVAIDLHGTDTGG